MDRNTVSASDIAVDGIAFNSACDTETGRQRIWDDSNDFDPATQDQIGIPRVAHRLAGNQQLTLDPLVGQDELL